MAKSASAFRQYDLQRALRAAKGAGLDVATVEVDPASGKIVITTTAGSKSETSSNSLDHWLANHARPT
jgi:hypothetical protein